MEEVFDTLLGGKSHFLLGSALEGISPSKAQGHFLVARRKFHWKSIKSVDYCFITSCFTRCG